MDFATSTTQTYKIGGNNPRTIQHLSYSVQYCNTHNNCFIVENACEGIGSFPGDKGINGKSVIYGDFGVQLFYPHSEGNDSDSNYVISTWMRNAEQMKKAFDKGAAVCEDSATDYYHLRGEGISLLEAVKIVESFAPISPLK